jgi:hypothetical protein
VSDAPGGRPLTDLAGERLAGYVDLWQRAGEKLSAGTYRSEDLVDDWFRWVGMVARDATAAATVVAGGAATRAASPAGGPPPEPDAASDDAPPGAPGDRPQRREV